jgi:CheY-like chemotaxis protein
MDPAIEAAMPTRRPFLMVVDDDAAVRESIQELFSSIGYDVLSAKDGRDALAKLVRARPDVILTDIFMDDGDGFELIRALRKAHVATPIVAMSGGRCGYDPLACAEGLGADVVIDKPFLSTKLVETIDRMVAHAVPIGG